MQVPVRALKRDHHTLDLGSLRADQFVARYMLRCKLRLLVSLLVGIKDEHPQDHCKSLAKEEANNLTKEDLVS
jgi:hypothetical protein